MTADQESVGVIDGEERNARRFPYNSDEAKRTDLDLLEVKVGMNEASVLSSLLRTVMSDAVTKLARKGVLGKLMHAGDYVFVSETTERLRKRERYQFVKCGSKMW